MRRGRRLVRQQVCFRCQRVGCGRQRVRFRRQRVGFRRQRIGLRRQRGHFWRQRVWLVPASAGRLPAPAGPLPAPVEPLPVRAGPRPAPARRTRTLDSGDTTFSFCCHQCHWWADLLSREYKVRRRLHPRRPRRAPSENSAARNVVFVGVSKGGAGGVPAAHPEPSGRIPDFVLL